MISFDNTEYAFAYKTDKELKKADFLFSTMGKPWLVNLGLNLMPAAIKLQIPFTKLVIRNTIFSQFVGGETLQETATVAQTTRCSWTPKSFLVDLIQTPSGEACQTT